MFGRVCISKECPARLLVPHSQCMTVWSIQSPSLVPLDNTCKHNMLTVKVLLCTGIIVTEMQHRHASVICLCRSSFLELDIVKHFERF